MMHLRLGLGLSLIAIGVIVALSKTVDRTTTTADTTLITADRA